MGGGHQSVYHLTQMHNQINGYYPIFVDNQKKFDTDIDIDNLCAPEKIKK